MSSQSKNSAYLFLSIIVLILIFGAIIYYNPIIYKAPWALLRLFELSILLLFSTYIFELEYHAAISYAFERMVSGSWSTMTSDMMAAVDNILVFEYTGNIYSIAIAWFLFKRYTKESYDKSLDFEELLKQLSRHFRFARCMIKLNPTEGVKVMDLTKGDFRLKDEIIPFMEKHNAVGRFQQNPTTPEITYLIREKAELALIKTMGRRFKSFDDLHYYEQWLCAAFIFLIKSTKYGEDQHYRDAQTILGDVSYFINEEGNLTRVNRLVKKAKTFLKDDVIKGAFSKHAFVYGVIKELFHRAKSKGVHPSLQFTWLFTKDRTLALVLEETGMPDERGAVFEVASPESAIECIAPRLHWTNETKQGTKIYEPACLYILDWINEYLINTYGFTNEAEAKETIKKIQDQRRKKIRRRLRKTTKKGKSYNKYRYEARVSIEQIKKENKEIFS